MAKEVGVRRLAILAPGQDLVLDDNQLYLQWLKGLMPGPPLEADQCF